MRELQAAALRFKRKAGAPWEYGIAVTRQVGASDLDVIIDMEGNHVASVWDFNMSYSDGSFTIHEGEGGESVG